MVVVTVTLPVEPGSEEVTLEGPKIVDETNTELEVGTVRVPLVTVPAVPETADVPLEGAGKGGDPDTVLLASMVELPDVTEPVVPEMVKVPLPDVGDGGRPDAEVVEIVTVEVTVPDDKLLIVEWLPDVVGLTVRTVPV